MRIMRIWPGTQAVRELSAKELYGSSILPQAFMPRWWNGLHEGLKILWAKAHVGSTPTSGTIRNSKRFLTAFKQLEAVFSLK